MSFSLDNVPYFPLEILDKNKKGKSQLKVLQIVIKDFRESVPQCNCLLLWQFFLTVKHINENILS